MHWIIDNYFEESELTDLLDVWPKLHQSMMHNKDQRLKGSTQRESLMHFYLIDFLREMNSQRVLKLLEQTTGIHGLIPDPWYVGGGLHESMPGGRLAVHTDYNVHPGYRARSTA
jgi:hypothetical protein